MLEEQTQAREQRFKARESDLLGRLSVADGWAQTASTSAEVSLKGWSELEQKLSFLRCQLLAVVPTPSVDTESRLASVHDELKAENNVNGKLRAEVQTVRDEMNNNRRRARDQYSRSVLSLVTVANCSPGRSVLGTWSRIYPRQLMQRHRPVKEILNFLIVSLVRLHDACW